VVISHEKYTRGTYLGKMYYMKLWVLESIGMGVIGKLTLTSKVKSKKDQLVSRMGEKSTKKQRKRKNHMF
jgi:hypothetical protein